MQAITQKVIVKPLNSQGGSHMNWHVTGIFSNSSGYSRNAAEWMGARAARHLTDDPTKYKFVFLILGRSRLVT